MKFEPKHALIAGVALCVAAAGCGSATHTSASPIGRPSNPVLAAYSSTVNAKTAKVTLHETVTSGTGQQSGINGSGVVDLRGKKAEFTFTAPQVGTIKELVISPELYLQLPASLRANIPGHKPWISLNVDKLVKTKLGASLSQLSSSSQASSQTLAYLESVSNSVKRVGTPTLHGVATTEYDATIDLTKSVKSKSPQAKAAVSKLEHEIGRSTLPAQVWIDRQHRVRQVGYQLSLKSAGQVSHVKFTMGLSAYGVPVDVTAPPASQTYDATAAALRSGAAGG